jgi:Domain of unknown function (DUF4188)
MVTIADERRTAVVAEGAVCFLVGMRINRLWRLHEWMPVLVAMPTMINELSRDRTLGCLGQPRTLVSGRTITVLIHFRSFAVLEAYARNQDGKHLPAWRRFNQRARRARGVGIFHETYVVAPGTVESLSVSMPPFSLGAAHGTVTVADRRAAARGRLSDPALSKTDS